MSGLSITGLHARHGQTPVLTGLDLTVPDGSLACVLGPSGCGKSTLLRVIAGFHHTAAGQVVVGGRTLEGPGTHVVAHRRRIGYVPQEGALFPHLSVAANIGFGLPRRARRDRVPEMLDLIGLRGFGHRHPHQLSGGQQQRVALARALAPQPSLVLLDEPFAALDAALRTELRAEVANTLRRARTTGILVTHDVDEALAVADLIAVLRGGRIVQAGSPDALYHQPVDADIARTLGEANLVPAALADGQADTAFGPLPVTVDSGGGSALVLLRPNQLQLTSPGPRSVEVQVAACQFRGHDYRLELTPRSGGDLPGGLIAYSATAAAPGHTAYVAARGVVHPLPRSGRTHDTVSRLVA
ncbi:MAG TPA: ABC transporter ATP-binding protein [Rugosimonospora sp.]|nr:ABC transporter ATP-binding protein [Rugosimonospora sp.]